MPKGPPQYQRTEEMLEYFVVGSRGDEDFWERGPGLHESQLRLAWESIQDEASANSAFYVDTLPCHLMIAR
jgi:hypothetical protein